jgi:hypothetical protein
MSFHGETVTIESRVRARVWRHGIHQFLEHLRDAPVTDPGSLDRMIAFIYLAYSMMMLLFETVRIRRDTD